jgi:hypothetical protein
VPRTHLLLFFADDPTDRAPRRIAEQRTTLADPASFAALNARCFDTPQAPQADVAHSGATTIVNVTSLGKLTDKSSTRHERPVSFRIGIVKK